MIKYITGRLLLFIPTLVAISLLAFIISINAPGDPIERMVSSSDDAGQTPSYGQEEQKSYWRKKLGLDLPVFYVTVRSLSQPAAINNITYDSKTAEALKRLSLLSGNAGNTLQFHVAVRKFIRDIHSLSGTVDDSTLKIIQPDLLTLKYASSFDEIAFRIERLRKLLHPLFNEQPALEKSFTSLTNAYSDLKTHTSKWKNYIPVLSFHFDNQYHRWMFGDGNFITGQGSVYTKGIIRGDFGISYQTRQPVSQVISEKIGWSLLFAVLSIFLAYLISIPVGVWAGAKKDSGFDKGSSLMLFLLYSMPVFWTATLLLMTFANTDVLHWFPASGIKPATGYPDNAGFITKVRSSVPYIILPLICYTYSSFAFISRTTRVAMLETMNQDFIRTAMAKGLPFNVVVFRHAFRNSLLPLITIFSNVFPMAIGGSVIIETIFTIPGMGFETVQSIHNQNYPMIVAIFTISGMLTVTGYLIADILYVWADPRITFENKR